MNTNINIRTIWKETENGIEHKYAITTTCPICGKESTVEVFAQDYFNWSQLGVYVQDAFPYLSDDERELLKSGICSTCWDAMFHTEEEEDE